jgi:hypothetical protein
MATRTLKDWSSWRDGLRSCVMRAAATSVVTQLTTLMGTNAVSSMNIPGLQNIALQWKTALVALVVQFLFHSLFAAASYIQNNPDPPTVTETVDTTFQAKAADGSTVAQKSTTTTTTPVDPATTVIKP